ncbi:hypothetical protein ACIHFD_66500 [Nonomuraea sp. NPDC051941]
MKVAGSSRSARTVGAQCAWGDYLNNPPAAHLGLTYPRAAIGRRPRRADM